jgi:hypothetical protein
MSTTNHASSEAGGSFVEPLDHPDGIALHLNPESMNGCLVITGRYRCLRELDAQTGDLWLNRHRRRISQ